MTNLSNIIKLLEQEKLVEALIEAEDMRRELRKRIREYETVLETGGTYKLVDVYRARIEEDKRVLGERRTWTG